MPLGTAFGGSSTLRITRMLMSMFFQPWQYDQ